MSNGELILYTTEDGSTTIRLRVNGETVWLTQLEIAELFQTSKQNISLHVNNIFSEKELDNSVVKEHLTTASDGKKYLTNLYSLKMILAIGYRIQSEDQAKRRKTMTMAEWEQKLDAFLTFNERDLLEHAGKISAQVAETLALGLYEEFDRRRRQEEKQIADAEDIALLEILKEKGKQFEPIKGEGKVPDLTPR